MKILIRSATIVNPQSPHHGQTKNLLIEDGLIREIGDQAAAGADVMVEQPGLHVSPGWVDMRASAPDPGHEYRETLRSVREAAAAGGFTEIALLPNTHPVVQTKESVAYVTRPMPGHPVTVHAVAAVTVDARGKDLTEMMDLQRAGVVAFSDGHNSLQNSDMVLKVLQYLQPFGGLFINRPEDTLLIQFGTMNEGVPATMLGMKGMPRMAESMMVMRDLRLLEYTGGKIHFACLSTAEAVELVRQAKNQVVFTDQDLMQFDTHLKVNPPFRDAADTAALWAGLADGTIDAVVTDHHPLDAEVKNLEFDLAAFGIIGLETAFAALHTQNGTQKEKLTLDKIVSLLAENPRRILGLPSVRIAEGEPANLTLFNPETEWTFAEKDIRSLSKNTPFVGRQFKGKAIGVVCDSEFRIQDYESSVRW